MTAGETPYSNRRSPASSTTRGLVMKTWNRLRAVTTTQLANSVPRTKPPLDSVKQYMKLYTKNGVKKMPMIETSYQNSGPG